MLDTGSPLEGEGEKTVIHSVSPLLSSHHASRSSTLGLSYPDGPPRCFSPVSLPPRPRSSSPSLEMAIKPIHVLGNGHEDRHPKLKYDRVNCEPQREEAKETGPSELIANPVNTPLQPFPSLSTVAHSLRREHYQTRRARHAQSTLRHLQIASARSARLASAARAVLRTLAKCIRSEDKQSFVNLLNAFNEVLDDCVQLSRSARADDLEDDSSNGKRDSFLDNLNPESRHATLEFLTKVGCDGDYVADCLARLTQQELLALLPEQGPAKPGDSIFCTPSWTWPRTSRALGFVIDAQADQLLSSSFGSPLEVMLYGVSGCSPNSKARDNRMSEVWSTACARLIAEQKPGSEKFVPAVLDLFAFSSEWPGKQRLELWMIQNLRNASFLLDNPNKQAFRMRASGRPDSMAEDEARSEAFYSQAVTTLIELFGDRTGASVVPTRALRLCAAIWRKLKGCPGYQRAFPQFVLTRWLFSTFITEVLTLPEAHVLVADCHITDAARYKVLREIANKAQKTVVDIVYSWRHGNVLAAETVSRVQSILDRLVCSKESTTAPTCSTEPPYLSDAEGRSFFAVTAADITTMINAFHPQRKFESTSDRGVPPSDVQSSASSISGFSLFSNAGQANETAIDYPPGTESHFQAFVPSGQAENMNDPHKSPVNGATLLEPVLLRDVCSSLEDLVSAPIIGSRMSNLWVTLTVSRRGKHLDTTEHAMREVSDKVLHQPWRSGFKASAASLEYLLASAPAELSLENSATGRDGNLLNSGVLQLYESCITNAVERNDFVEAHNWSQQLLELQAQLQNGLDLGELLATIERRAQMTIENLELLTISSEEWLSSVNPAMDMLTSQLLSIERDVIRLRNKMWFVADVRISGAYDEARSIGSALRVMGRPKRQTKSRLAPPLRHWSGAKNSNANMQLKTEAQVLELLSASPEHGGPNKLSDDQARTTSSWMQRNNVENLCQGEERLHRLCMEIRKCVDKLISSDSAVLFSNPLFAHDDLKSTGSKASQGNLAALANPGGRFNHLSLQTNVPASIDAISTASHPLSSVSSHDNVDSRSPALTNKSSGPFWSPVVTEARSPSSATSIGSLPTRAGPSVPGSVPRLSGADKLTELQQHLTSLLISDLAASLFNEGSETDRAFSAGLGGELLERHFQDVRPTVTRSKNMCSATGVSSDSKSGTFFDFDAAFAKMVNAFSASHNPSVKLSILYDMDRLLPIWMQGRRNDVGTLPCVERQSRPGIGLSRNHADASVEGFRILFSTASTRPATIFRDLQFIAALTPSAVLESTSQGRAFWNAAVAASGIKQEARTIMVETADSIIAFHSNNRGHGRSSSSAQQQRDSATFTNSSRTPSAEDVGRYKMADAAYLLQITAKEGDPVAQRELATLYLTHPELMDHVVAPFSSPKEVFKEELESKWRKNQDPNRCDPTTMCVAHHWMSLSSKGGDALAKEYLKQREEMERLP